MIAFACHTWSFPDLTLPEAFGLIARLGFRHVDIGSGTALNAARAASDPARLAADLRADLKTFALQVSDIYLMLPRISLAATPEDAERRARELELFRTLIPFALELGAGGITVSPGLAPPPDAPPIQPPSGSQPRSPTEAGAAAVSAAEFAFSRAAEALRAMHETARSSGLRLSIEPHLDSIAPTPAQALRLIEAVPGLTITLDWAELACQNIPLDEIVRLLPHTRHMHVRGAARGRLQTPLEKSALDLRRLIEVSLAAGYSGTIAVELMQLPPGVNRHGAQKVNAIREAAAIRDALRRERDAALRPA